VDRAADSRQSSIYAAWKKLRVRPRGRMRHLEEIAGFGAAAEAYLKTGKEI
jgi:hypothetical protein